MERQVGDYEYNVVQVVFRADGGSKFQLDLYGDKGKDGFDIESPGSYLMSFKSEEEVNGFILILKKSHEDLNAIFK